MNTIGVINIDPWFLLNTSENLKSDLIYFDKLIYTFGDDKKILLEKFCKSIKMQDSFIRKMKDLEVLEKTGLLIEYNEKDIIKDFKQLKDDKTEKYVKKTYSLAKEFMDNEEPDIKNRIVDFLARFREIGQLESRKNSILLNSKQSDNFVPIIKDSYYNSIEEPYKTSTVLSVVLKRFPVISEETSLEKLLDFKSDSENNLALQRLRNWVFEISNTNYSEKEIEQKFDYLLAEYQKGLEIHKLKYNVSQIETYTNITLEILENVLKLNFSKVGKAIFDLTKQDITLMEEEQKIVGKELALIHKLNKKNSL